MFWEVFLFVKLARPPLFFKETDPQPRKHTLWQATSDFTGGQASMHRWSAFLIHNGFHMIRVSHYGQWNLYIVVVRHSMLLAIAVLLEYKHTNWFCSMFLFAGDFSLCFKGFKCKTHNAYLGFCSTLCIMIFKFTLMILLPLLEENKELLLCAAFWAVGT